jgi:flagellar basal-body rod protein FlgF
VGKLKMVTPNAEQRLKRGDDGYFRAATGGTLDADPLARLQDAALEGSNVSPIEAMVGMIQVARQFEQQMKLLQTAEKNDQNASQLLNVNG